GTTVAVDQVAVVTLLRAGHDSIAARRGCAVVVAPISVREVAVVTLLTGIDNPVSTRCKAAHDARRQPGLEPARRSGATVRAAGDVDAATSSEAARVWAESKRTGAAHARHTVVVAGHAG